MQLRKADVFPKGTTFEHPRRQREYQESGELVIKPCARYAEDMLSTLDLEGCNATPTPATKELIQKMGGR